MKIETDYDVGDEVYAVYYSELSEGIVCVFKGMVESINISNAGTYYHVIGGAHNDNYPSNRLTKFRDEVGGVIDMVLSRLDEDEQDEN